MKKATTLFAFAVLCLSASTLRADAIGTPVTGTLNFSGISINYFDPANGFVPAGCGNSTGSTTVPIGSGVEFCFQDSGNRDTADFTGSTLTISDEPFTGTNLSSFVMTFTDPAFLGFTLIDNGLGLSYSFSGTALTVSFPGGNIKGTEISTFDFTSITPIPEPGTLALMATGLLGAAGLIHRKRRS